MKRKILMVWLAILVVAVPLLGSFSTEAAAASTRVAVIKELKGTVKVKKAGGSKEFTAFAKMSLNEGDVLAVGSGGSAVLQFANGTSEDDKMTAASNTKLTFSKLSNKKGTTTKVSMWSGSAWVDVKSITNKDDQFTLETPTAVMGVRGTHLLVTVNPNTGATNLMVAAGVVQTTATGERGETQFVYPTQNALITDEGNSGEPEITIASADLEALMKQGNAEIVRAIIQGAADITAENEQYVKRYENGEVPKEIGGTSADLERFKNNTQNLLGALATKAVQTGLITQERINQLIEEASQQTGFKVDLTKNSLQLTEADKAKQEAQRKKEEALAKREAERKAKEDAERRKLEETLRKLEEERKAREKAAQEAAEAKKKKAVEKYESQLSDAEKKRLKEDAEKRQAEIKAAQSSASPTPSLSPSPSPTPSTGSGGGPVLSDNANLSGLTVSVGNDPLALTPTFASGTAYYTATFPATIAQVRVAPIVADTGKATVKVNGASLSGGAAIVDVGTGPSKSVSIVVTAQNGATKIYTVNLVRAGTNNAAKLSGFGISYRDKGTGEWIMAGEVSFQGNENQTTWLHSVPYEFEDIRIAPRTLDPAAKIVSVNGAVLTEGLYYPVHLAVGTAQTLSIESLASDQVTRQTFNLQIIRDALMTIPSSLESWTTTTTPATTNIEWTNIGHQQFAAQSPNTVSSFTLALSFNTSRGIASAKLFNAEETELATWSQSGDSATLNLQPGLNEYILRFYTSNGSQVNGHTLFFFNGETDPSVTDLGYVQVSNLDGSFNTYATQTGDHAFAQVSPDLENVRIRLYSSGNVIRLYADGGAYPLKAESNDVYNVQLQPGSNHYQIVVKDWTGFFKKTYELTIARGAEDPLPEYVDKWSITESAAKPKFLSREDYENIVNYNYSVVVGEHTNTIHLNMKLANEEHAISSLGIYQGEAPLESFDEVPPGFEIADFEIELNPYDIYSDVSILYQSLETSQYFRINLIVARGDLDEDAAKLSGIEIGFAEWKYFGARPINDHEFVAYAGPDTDGHTSFDIMPYADFYEVYQWVDGTKVELEDGYMDGKSAEMKQQGWHDFEIVSWDPARVVSKTYELHIYKSSTEVVPGGLSSVYLLPMDDSSLLDSTLPLEVKDRTFFNSYRSNEPSSFKLAAIPNAGGGQIKVFLDGSSTSLPDPTEYYSDLEDLTAGWHEIEIYSYDSLNSIYPTEYTYWIWIGEDQTEIDLDYIYAEDVHESRVHFIQDPDDAFKWSAEVVPDAYYVDLSAQFGNPSARVVEVVSQYGSRAGTPDDDDVFRLYLEENGDTLAQIWVEIAGKIFVYRIEIHQTSSDLPVYVDYLDSWVTNTEDPVTWQYSSRYRFYSEIDLAPSDMANGIYLNLSPKPGYTVMYSGNGDYDAETGFWRNISSGANQLTVTISRDEWLVSYSIYAIVGDDLPTVQGRPGVELSNGEIFFQVDPELPSVDLNMVQWDTLSSELNLTVENPGEGQEQYIIVNEEDYTGRKVFNYVHILFAHPDDFGLGLADISVTYDVYTAGSPQSTLSGEPGWFIPYISVPETFEISLTAEDEMVVFDLYDEGQSSPMTPSTYEGNTKVWSNLPYSGGFRVYTLTVFKDGRRTAYHIVIGPGLA